MTTAQQDTPIEKLCQVAQVSRAGYYRSLAEKEPKTEEMMVRAAIQEIVIRHRRRYGSPKITRELRRRGMMINHKRVERLMREDNLLALRRYKFRATTDSRHDCPVYQNLCPQMTVNRVNQLWVADITYIRLAEEWVYLAVVLDRFSRRVVGWELGPNFTTELTLRALRAALRERVPAAGLVHHSDRGVQYAAREYIQLLEAHQIQPSMSRSGNPYDNAFCESFMRTLKCEEINGHRWRDMNELRENVGEFLDTYYNRERLHSALGYQTPAEFEAQAAESAETARVKGAA